jgi:hypothetical protein
MWKSLIMIFALISAVAFYVIGLVNYMPLVPGKLASNSMPEDFRPVDRDRVQKAMLESDPAHDVLPALPGRNGPRTRRAAGGPEINPSNGSSNYTAATEKNCSVSIASDIAGGKGRVLEAEVSSSDVPEEQFLDLVERLKHRGACVGEYQVLNDVGKAVSRAKSHLRVLDYLADAGSKLRKLYLDRWVEEVHGGFFNATNQSYRTVEKRWKEVKGVMKDVDKLERYLAFVKKELKGYHELYSYYEGIWTSGRFEVLWAKLSLIESELVYMRAAEYIESRLRGSGVPSGIFKVEAESYFNSSYRKLGKILVLADIMDHVMSSSEYKVDRDKLRRDMEYIRASTKEIEEMNGIIDGLRNSAPFRKAMEELKEEIKKECEKLREKASSEKQITVDGGSSFSNAFLNYLHLSYEYGPEGKLCFGVMRGLRKLAGELDRFKTNASSTDC